MEETSDFSLFYDNSLENAITVNTKDLSVCVRGWEINIQIESETSISIEVINPSGKIIKRENLYHTVPVG